MTEAVDPGWVLTKMGGAPVDLNKGYQTPVCLGVSKGAVACVSNTYFHQKTARYPNTTRDADKKEALLTKYAQLTGVTLNEE